MPSESFFPAQVRVFPEHQNQRDWVMAEHVNNIYAEMHGIESTVGTMPHEYTAISGKRMTYHDVDHRLDVMQRTGERLDYYQYGLLDATTKGWNLPVADIKSSGMNLRPRIDQTKNWDAAWTDWYKMTWDQPIVDPEGMVPKKTTTLTCPRTGWWMFTANFHMGRSYGPETQDHRLDVALTLSGLGMNKWPYATVASDNASMNRHSPAAFLRCSFAYAGPWHKGNKAQFWLAHGDSLKVKDRRKYPYPVDTKKAYGWCGLTYIRALPETRIPWNPMQSAPPVED
ncbi:hypothetical protein [Streptomyces sp. NBC_00470]|uniref:hypothetical protein n=1 Tax=Streptomyces sp. NBC_00470 TaxID=2975753 RepID=UPI0030E12777